jgi:hypothetical protein
LEEENRKLGDKVKMIKRIVHFTNFFYSERDQQQLLKVSAPEFKLYKINHRIFSLFFAYLGCTSKSFSRRILFTLFSGISVIFTCRFFVYIGL